MIRATALVQETAAPAKPAAAPAKPRTKSGSFASQLRGVAKPDAEPGAAPDAAPGKPTDAKEAAIQLANVAIAIVPMLVDAIQHPATKATPPATPAPQPQDPQELATASALVSELRMLAPQAKPEAPVTPLEQAVHDLLEQLDRSDPHRDAPQTAQTTFGHTLITATQDAPPEAPGAPKDLPAVARPEAPAQAEAAANPSHVHLVVEDGATRVVLTVAVRGEEVRVQMRANDDSLAADLARNAGALDHALRARGLDLHDFTAERDPDHGDRDQPRREPQRRDERFTLEEPQ